MSTAQHFIFPAPAVRPKLVTLLVGGNAYWLASGVLMTAPICIDGTIDFGTDCAVDFAMLEPRARLECCAYRAALGLLPS
jgi:hypothetical protein